jgi:cytoskeletal protein CcmA (bactofilin family)
LEGNIETFGNIRIEGKVIGNIKSKSKIALGNSSHVEGNISAQNADIEGEVKGKLEISEMLVLKSTSVVHGDIITSKLVVEPGAVFNGSCKMGAAVKDIKGMDNVTRSLRTEEARVN